MYYKKRKYSRVSGRKRYGRKKRYANFRRNFKRPSFGSKYRGYAGWADLPDNKYLKFKWSWNGAFNQVSGTDRKVIFGNGLNNPAQESSGAFPNAFTLWAQFYNAYTVMGSKIKISYIPYTDQSNNIRLTVIPTLDSTLTEGSGMHLEDQLHSKTIDVPFTTVGTVKRTLTHFIKSSKILGKSKTAILDDDTFSALTSGNPSQKWFWIVSGYDSQGYKIHGSLEIDIVYYVRMFKKVAITRSTA